MFNGKEMLMISSHEWRWTKGFSIFVIVFTLLPYIVGYARQGEDWRYTGLLFGVEDGNSYIAKMRRGSVGDWLFRSPYTAEKQNGFLGFVPYLLLGKLVSPPGDHEQLVAVFHIFRSVSIYFLVNVVFRLIAYQIADVILRRLCLIVCVFGGGLGWSYLTGINNLWGGELPLEFYSPESFGFLAVIGIPHLVAARGFLLLSVLILISNPKEGWIKPGICIGLAWIGLGLMQPLTVLIGWFVCFSFVMVLYISKKINPQPITEQHLRILIGRGVIGMAISSPIVIYTYLSFQYDPYLIEWAKQNIIQSPPVWDYLLAYGVMFLFIFVVWRILLFDPKPSTWLFLGWSLSFPILAYFPYPLQRRLPESIWVAIVILAFYGIERLNLKKITAPVLLASISLIAPLFFFSASLSSVINPNLPLFRPKEEIELFQFLRDNIPQNQVVLANYDLSNTLPAWVSNFVLIGHGPESVHLATVQRKVDLFLSGGYSLLEIKQLFSDYDIRLVILTSSEMEKINNSHFPINFLDRIYDNQKYNLFKVVQDH